MEVINGRIYFGSIPGDISVGGGLKNAAQSEDSRGVIEYIDTEESWHVMIAMKPVDFKSKTVHMIIVKFILVLFWVFLVLIFHSVIIISLQEIHISLLWENRQWVFIH